MSELPVLESIQDPEQSGLIGGVIRIRLIGILASSAGARQLDLPSRNLVTVMDLVEGLLAKVGKKQFEGFLIDSGTRDPRPNVIILLDDQDCNLFGGLRADVRGKKTVTIIPVAHGG